MGSAGNMGTFCGEGNSSSRPPLLDGTNYDYWSNRMKFHVQSIDYILWRIIIDGPLIPMKIKNVQAGTTSEEATEEEKKKALAAGASTIEEPITDADKINIGELRPDELKKIALNAKAVNLLHNAMCREEYARIKSCKTAKEIWDLLETAHVGTNQVKQTKVRLLTKEYQKFEMKEGESIADMHLRFNEILNNLEALGKTFSREDINGKLFEALTDDYEGKICAITEAKDVGTIPLVELIGSLKAQEEVLAYKKARRKNKKSLALVAAKAEKMLELDESDDEADDIAMLTKNFKKILKYRNNKKEYSQ